MVCDLSVSWGGKCLNLCSCAALGAGRPDGELSLSSREEEVLAEWSSKVRFCAD